MATPTVVPNGLAAKLAAQAAEVNSKPSKPKAELVLDETKDALSFYVPKEVLLANVGKSSTGDSEGVTLSVMGEFKYTIDGHEYTFKLNMRGGWATVKMLASQGNSAIAG